MPELLKIVSFAQGDKVKEAQSNQKDLEDANQALEALQKQGMDQFAGFQHAFFAKLVPNVRKLGLLEANGGHLRQKWGEAGLLEFEFADDTGSDYENYDEVAKDRAERAAAAAAAS